MPDAPSPALVLMVALAFGYLLGSIPFGLILTRLAGTRDLRSIGSGNIGATNVLRTGRKDLAAATLVLDALKGTAAVLAARHYGGEVAAMAAGAGAFIGHIAPVWLRFRGGKGVATYLGVTLGLFWPAALAFAIAWLAAAYYTRYSSLSALMATVATIGATMLLANDPLAMFLAVLAMVMWAKHHENIRRLFDGTESKIGAKD